MIPFVRWRFNYKYDKVYPRSHPYIVLSNHTTNWDPMLVGISFPQHMYFVATEHIFRQGVLSRLLTFFIAPILRLKTRTEMYTAMVMLRTLKAGENICMFPEGSNTWNGVSTPIVPSTAKLVKRSNATLITYRIEGGHLSLPRWGKTIRRGAMRGYMVNEYPPEQLAAMSSEEVQRAINEDLYFNAFAHNAKAQISFKGKRMAEHLELALFYCSDCKAIGSLRSDDDTLTCDSCGLKLRYNPQGRFESLTERPVTFDTPLDWYNWQIGYLDNKREDYLQLAVDEPVCSDEGQELYSYQVGGDSLLVATGTLRLYKDRLEFEDEERRQTVSFPLKEITDMGTFTQTTFNFTIHGKEHFEVRSAIPRSSIKYLMLCNALEDVKVLP
ncbi:MAG: lysophospholipid acyltransferase family protein [Syntrophomonadaceae bacterium]|nr:lysophospholipid acyltransferase family protein [Syntrophomonadaceae bacterium]